MRQETEAPERCEIRSAINKAFKLEANNIPLLEPRGSNTLSLIDDILSKSYSI